MDWLDWVERGAGIAFGLLTLGFAFARLSAFTERDVVPAWWLGFIVTGGILAISLIADWLLPIKTTVYLANGGGSPREVLIDADATCLPGKSYASFAWRVAPPSTVTVIDPGTKTNTRYAIGKGTWLINVSPGTVSADMYDTTTPEVDFEALLSNRAQALRVDSRFGRPFRMFSQSSFDRVYAPDGDIHERSIDGSCPKDDAAAK